MGAPSTPDDGPREATAPTIVARPPRRLSRPAALAVGGCCVVVALAMIATLVAATMSDDDGGYPGYRSGPIAQIIGAQPALQGSDVDPFEKPVADGLGSYPGLGPWTQRVKAWKVSEGVASATPYPGAPAIVTVQAKHPKYLFQVDVLNIRAGSGLLFRYKDAKNYWSLQNVGKEGWIVVRVVNGGVRIVRTLSGNTGLLGTVGIWTDGEGAGFQVAFAFRAVVQVADPTLSDALGIGLTSTNAETKFDNMSVYDG